MAEDFSKPEDWDPADGDGSDPPSRPALHSSHVVMVGVSAEVAIAIAVASFAMGAALTGALCYFLQFRKNAAKRVSNIYFHKRTRNHKKMRTTKTKLVAPLIVLSSDRHVSRQIIFSQIRSSRLSRGGVDCSTVGDDGDEDSPMMIGLSPTVTTVTPASGGQRRPPAVAADGATPTA